MSEVARLIRPLLLALIISAERGSRVYAAAVQLLGAIEDELGMTRTIAPRAERRKELL